MNFTQSFVGGGDDSSFTFEGHDGVFNPYLTPPATPPTTPPLFNLGGGRFNYPPPGPSSFSTPSPDSTSYSEVQMTSNESY